MFGVMMGQKGARKEWYQGCDCSQPIDLVQQLVEATTSLASLLIYYDHVYLAEQLLDKYGVSRKTRDSISKYETGLKMGLIDSSTHLVILRLTYIPLVLLPPQYLVGHPVSFDQKLLGLIKSSLVLRYRSFAGVSLVIECTRFLYDNQNLFNANIIYWFSDIAHFSLLFQSIFVLAVTSWVIRWSQNMSNSISFEKSKSCK